MVTVRSFYDGDASGNYEVYRCGAGFASPALLTNSTSYDSFWPKWSRDKGTVMFVRTPEGIHDSSFADATVWTVPVTGGSPTKRIDEPGTAGVSSGWTALAHPEYDDDGAKIVLQATTATGTAIVTVLTSDWSTASTRAAYVTATATARDPSFSPDGETIVFAFRVAASSTYGLATVPTTTSTTVTTLISDATTYGGYWDPYYNPAGTKIAWLVWTGAVDGSHALGQWGIKVCDADGSNAAWLIDDGNVNSKPAWSADGSRIYFHRFRYSASTGYEIWSMRASDGGDLTRHV